MNEQQETGQSRFFSKLITWLIALIALYTVTGFLIVPAVLKSVLPKKLSQQLNRQVKVKVIHFNPFELSINIFGLSITGRTGSENLLTLDELYADVQIKSIMDKSIIMRDIRLKGPVVNIARNSNGDYNFSDLMVNETETRPS